MTRIGVVGLGVVGLAVKHGLERIGHAVFGHDLKIDTTIRDVIATELVYLKLLPWIDNHPNVGAYEPSTEAVCPKCGSDNLQRRGTSILQQGRYPRYQCQACGGWSRGKDLLMPLEVRRAQLVPR